MSPYQFEYEIAGGVMGPAVAGGKRPADIRVASEGITARLEDGSEFSSGWKGLSLELGGSDGNTVFCHSKATKLTFYSNDADFQRALETLGGNELADQLARIAGQRVSSRPKHLAGCGVVLVVVAALIWGVPRAFRATLDLTVDALPFSVDETIGENVVDAMDPGGKEIDNEVLNAAVAKIIERLEPHIEQAGIQFEFRIIENSLANAYALPGGYITVFTGLMSEADAAEHVAGVLAHEIAHVTRRHGLRRIAHSLGVVVGMQLILGDAEGLAGLAAELFTLASVNDYSQDQETEADIDGAQLLDRSGIDPLALAEFFERLEESEGDIPDSLSWMSTHPQHRERIAAIKALRIELDHAETYTSIDIDWEAVHAELEQL